VTRVVRQLLEGPLVLVHVVAQADFRIYVISEQVNVCLTLRTTIQGWEFKKGFLDRAVVVDVDRVLEHVVHEVGAGLDEVVQGGEYFEVLPLLFMENVEAVLVLVQLHLVDSLLELVALLLYHFLSFLDLLLFLLELLDLLVNLLLHHLEQVLVLDLQLIHYSSK